MTTSAMTTTTGTMLDGKALAKDIRAKLATDVAALIPKLGRPPGLAVLLVGDDPASAVYVRNKERAAKKVGLHSEVIRLPASTNQAQLNQAIDNLNSNPAIDAFIVQLPLPAHLDEDAALSRIDPAKDADGLHPANLGKLCVGLPAPRACTPSGVMALLDRAQVPLKGAKAVVIGRSNIVGKPVALMLLERHATVTLCHSRTQNLAQEVRQADVVVAAVGRANFVQGDWIKPGAAVIDVGINRNADGKLVGDVDTQAAAQNAAVITPVPGGVGPMTVAMLLSNTVQAATAAAAAR